MRNIKSLLKILKEQYCKYPSDGLCSKVKILRASYIITIEESMLLASYIEANKPKNSVGSIFAFYWKGYDVTPRKKWLDKHIALCELKSQY